MEKQNLCESLRFLRLGANSLFRFTNIFSRQGAKALSKRQVKASSFEASNLNRGQFPLPVHTLIYKRPALEVTLRIAHSCLRKVSARAK
jgi:hypothetical protein